MNTSLFLEWLVRGTVGGSLSILLVAAVAPLCRRWLGARVTFWLWALVLVRLFVPGITSSPLPWGGSPAASGGTQWSATASVSEGPRAPFPSVGNSSRNADEPPRFSAAAVAATTWALGAGLILGLAMVRSVRARRLARRARDLSADPTLAPLLTELAGASRRFGVRETAELRSPALCGIWRPIILLPLDWRERMTPAELRFVLLHEIGHFERGDLVWRWAFFLARAVHWFNPLVWMAGRLARNHQEMACDEWVIHRIGAPSAPAYGEAILAAARRVVPRALGFPVQAEMAESRAGLRRRLAHLVNARSHGWNAGFVAVVIALVGFSLTGFAPNEPPPTPSTSNQTDASLTPPSLPESMLPASLSGPLQVRIESSFLQLSPEAAAEFLGSDAALGSVGVRSVYSPEQFQDFLRKLDQKKGVDMISAPRVTVRSGQRANVTIVREFPYPTKFDAPIPSDSTKVPATPAHFAVRNLGVSLEVEPSVSSDHGIQLVVSPEITEFSGFINYGGSRKETPDLARDAIAEARRQITTEHNVINQPVFSSRRMTTVLSLKDGQTVLIGVTNSTDGPLLPNDATFTATPAEPTEPRTLLIFVTAKIVTLPPGAGASSPNHQQRSTPSAPRPASNGKLPYGVPVPGKPGFVTSPYAPNRLPVDLRGFPPQTEVKDPYTGKIFLVP